MDINEFFDDDPQLRSMYHGTTKLLTKTQKVDSWKMVMRLARRLFEHTDEREVVAEIIAASPLLDEIGWDRARWLKHKAEILEAGEKYQPPSRPADYELEQILCECEPSGVATEQPTPSAAQTTIQAASSVMLVGSKDEFSAGTRQRPQLHELDGGKFVVNVGNAAPLNEFYSFLQDLKPELLVVQSNWWLELNGDDFKEAVIKAINTSGGAMLMLKAE